MKTIMMATMNIILPEEGSMPYNKQPWYETYDYLDRVYNFSLGPSIFALVSKSQLKELAKRDYPFLRDFNHCFEDDGCRAKIDLTKHIPGEEIGPIKVSKFNHMTSYYIF